MKRNLLKTIEEKMPTFSKGQKRIAAYIIENYDKAAYMTASKLGAIADNSIFAISKNVWVGIL